MNKADFLNHTYIVAGSGSGKSQLIRTIDNFIGENTVVIDPHGDLAKEMGLTAYNIEPYEKRFVINPFDIDDKSDRSRATAGQEITKLLTEMIRDVGLSSLMETIAFPVIYTLLKLPYADFKMFSECINPTKGKARLRAIRHLVDPVLHGEIWDSLEDDTYDTSKQSLFNRLQGFLNKRAILETVCGRDDFKNYFDIATGVKCKNIVLNLAGLGDDEIEVLGRLFMTRMQIWAISRQKIPEHMRTPVFLIVDEFQNFIGNHLAKTLEQYGRKYKLYMILAHQHVGQLSSDLRGAIMANMQNKIAGKSDSATRQKVTQEMGIEPEALEKLGKGHFYGRFDNAESFHFKSYMLPPVHGKERIFCHSENSTELIDGWEGLDVEQDHHEAPTRRSKTTRHEDQGNQAQPTTTKPATPKPPKGGFAPKFDI